MPTISMFYGILIKMFYDDHAPPHFHAEYAEYELVVTISPVKIIKRVDSVTPRRITNRLGLVQKLPKPC